MMIKNLKENFKQVLKYRNSIIFKKEYDDENSFLKSSKTKNGSLLDIENKDNAHLRKILEITDFIQEPVIYS